MGGWPTVYLGLDNLSPVRAMISVAGAYIREARRIRNTVLGQRDWKITTAIITYELGAVVKALFYAEVYPDKSVGYKLQAKSEIMDVIAQVETLCQDQAWDFDELRIQGAEKFKERMEHVQTARTGNRDVPGSGTPNS